MTEQIGDTHRPTPKEVLSLARTIDDRMGGPLHQGLRYGDGELVLIKVYPEELDPSINKKQANLARLAVLLSGTVVGTRKEGVVLVPESTINILSELNLPYKIVSAGSSNT